LGQREEIERLIGEAYASLRLQEWTEFNKKVSELALYPRGLTTNIIKEKMAQVSEPRAMSLAYIHEAVTAFSASSDKGASPQKLEVEYPLPTLPVEQLPEPQRSLEIGWLAGMIDAEGRVDEGPFGKDEVGRIDRKVYRWEWMRPRVRLSSTTRAIIDKFDELVGAHARWTEERPPPYLPYHYAEVTVAKAIKLLILCEPHFIKWKERARQLIEKYRKHPEVRTR